MRRLWSAFASLTWPVDCPCCGVRVDRVGFCASCAALVEPRDGPRCEVCDVDLMVVEPTGRCGRCLTRPPPYERGWGCFDYAGPVGDAIRGAKYAGRLDGLPVVARCMVERLPEALCADPPEVVVPMALHWRRVDARGFSPPLQLAAAVGRSLGVPRRSRWLRRVRDTPAQAGLSDAGRQVNMRGAFSASGRVRGRDLLLVDDVVTTGATARAAAKVLQRAGAKRIRLLAAAYVSRD